MHGFGIGFKKPDLKVFLGFGFKIFYFADFGFGLGFNCIYTVEFSYVDFGLVASSMAVFSQCMKYSNSI